MDKIAGFRTKLSAVAVLVLASCGTLAGSQFAVAQQPPPPNRDPGDRLIQPTPTPAPLPPEEGPAAPPVPAPAPAVPGADGPTEFLVKRIRVTGSTVYTDADLAPIIGSLQGRRVTRAEITEAADAVTRRYLADGYLTSRAILVEESLVSGEVELRAIEGSVETIEIEGLDEVRDGYVRSRIERGTRAPLRPSDLEDQLRLLQADPLFELVEASLKAGSGLGRSVVTVRVTEASPWTFRFNSDNYSPPSVGGERFEAEIGYNTLTGRGDRFSAEYSVTTLGGSRTADFNYRLPVNARNGAVAVRVLLNNNDIVTEEIEDLGIEGEFELYEISFRQPFIRTPRQELAMSVGFSHQRGQTFVAGLGGFPLSIGPDEDGNSITSTFRFGQEYIRRSPNGAWALRSQFNVGTLAFDATDNSGDIPDSSFVSWLGQVQRVQVLNENNFLIFLADIQLSPDPLLPSEQFVIGGGQSVRGYRQNLLGGDNGVRFTVEDRLTLVRNDAGQVRLQLAPFVDFGAVFNGDNPNDFSQDNTVLAGIGTGIIWEPLAGLNIRLDFGIPLVDVDEGDNIQDDGLYFSVIYSR